jgi:hypothetical protein
MKHPIEFVTNIPVKLGANEALFRGQHIMILRVAGTSGIKKTYFPFFHLTLEYIVKKQKREDCSIIVYRIKGPPLCILYTEGI